MLFLGPSVRANLVYIVSLGLMKSKWFGLSDKSFPALFTFAASQEGCSIVLLDEIGT